MLLQITNLVISSLAASTAASSVLQQPLSMPISAVSSGCGTELTIASPGNTTEISILLDGFSRTYLVHIPADYDETGNGPPLPLMLSYHGANKDAYYQENLTQFNRFNAVMVYPRGYGKTWQGFPGKSKSIHDVRFTEVILDQILENVCIDTSKIYASGKSIGGGFMDVLACSRISKRFAAFAAVSGAFYASEKRDPDACVERLLTPIMEIHGLNDTRIKYTGGVGEHGAPLPSILSWLEGWADRNGCKSPYATKNTSLSNYTLMQWMCGDDSESGKADIVHYAVEGLGHAWPALSSNSDGPASVIDASEKIYNFFMNWTNPFSG